jgi:aspartyl-tRNA(Asn)/glutamyl-tRNA(Gln) amidotransferase subunit A
LRVAPLHSWVDCNRTILQAEAYAIHQRDLQERPEEFAAITRGKILPGAFIPASEYIKAQQWRRALAQGLAEAMRGFDAVITLSSLDLPCKIDDPEMVAKTYDRQCRLVFNVTGTPAIAVPTGFSAAGVPLGMQIAARAFQEPMLFRIAQAYCAAAGFCDRRPPAVAALCAASIAAQ